MVNEAVSGSTEIKDQLTKILNNKTNLSDTEIEKIKQKILEKQTADWNTYHNAEYNFQIKYPESLNLVSSTPTSSNDFIIKLISEGEDYLLIRRYETRNNLDKDAQVKKSWSQKNYYIAILDLTNNTTTSTTTNLIINTFLFNQ